MCGCCNETGQWNELQSVLTKKKSKNKEISDLSRPGSKINSIKATLEEIRLNTSEMKLLDRSTINNIFANFRLPVSINFF